MQACWGHWLNHMRHLEADELFQPKHHIVFHLLSKIPLLGNPQLCATWLDEALNKVLKSSCRDTSQAVFERTVLLRMRELLRQ